MPPPTSTDDLVTRLRRSGLVPPADLDAYLGTLPPGLPPRPLLDRMIADQYLTPFQADRLAAGKYKGFLLGGYIILDKIGTGGMGQVYLAEHTAMRRLVAVKVLNVPAGEDNVARERFFREARAAAVLSHPNIVRVFDLNREGQLPYLVMEYVDGISLQTLVTRTGPVAPAVAADWARQAALGLQHAHEKGLVHRDIKPGNVLVDKPGNVRILDFGLVRNLEDVDTKLTNQLGGHSILGTADYLAPEQAVNSSAVDIRADVYSLGATLYFLIAGHPMFPDGRTAQKLMWQQWKEPTPLRELKPEVPEGLAAVVHKAVAKKAEDRFQTPQELADALAPFAAPPTGPDPTLIPTPPTRRFTAASLRAGDPGPSSSGVRSGPSSSITTPVPRPAFPPSPGGLTTPAPRAPFGPRPASDDTPHVGGRFPTPPMNPVPPPRPLFPAPSAASAPPPRPLFPAPPTPMPAAPDAAGEQPIDLVPGAADLPPLPLTRPGSAPIQWKHRKLDEEDVILGSVGFVMGPSAARPAPAGAAQPAPAPGPAPAAPPPAEKPFPWLVLAAAAGVGAGAAVVGLFLLK